MSSIKCEICTTNDFKYKCPGCSMKTCSLDCCRKHKTDTGCNGQRDKTKFVNKEDFDEKTLLNDYRFLEEQAAIINAFERTSAKIVENEAQHRGSIENLRKFVHQEFGISLKLMPSQTSRHMNNKTRFNRATKGVSWSMEFMFHLSDKKNLFKLNTKSVLFSSKLTIKEVVLEFYNKFKMDLLRNGEKFKSVTPIDLFNKDLFEKGEFDHDLNVLFEVNDFYLKKKYYIKFNSEDTLESCLARKTFIEYPTLYLVKSNDLHNYEIREDKIVENVGSSKSMEHDSGESKESNENEIEKESPEEGEESENESESEPEEEDNESKLNIKELSIEENQNMEQNEASDENQSEKEEGEC